MIRSVLLVALLGIGIGGCRKATSAVPSTPQQAVEAMRVFAAGGEWKSYWSCFSLRGKGWFVGEAATSLAWDAHAQPVTPGAGEASRKFIEKYDLTKQRLERREGESVEEQCLRIARTLDARGPEFCEELFLKRKFPAFPGVGEIRVVAQKAGRAVLETPPDLKCGLSLLEGHWRVDGPALPE